MQITFGGDFNCGNAEQATNKRMVIKETGNLCSHFKLHYGHLAWSKSANFIFYMAWQILSSVLFGFNIAGLFTATPSSYKN